MKGTSQGVPLLLVVRLAGGECWQGRGNKCLSESPNLASPLRRKTQAAKLAEGEMARDTVLVVSPLFRNQRWNQPAAAAVLVNVTPL